MKIEEKISVFFTNTIRHAQRHRLTAGDILSRPEEMSGSERLRKQIKLKGDKNREAKELAREQRSETVTATIEAAEDLKRKLANRIGAEATTRVRTMASILVNGFKEHTHNRLLIDEAMMNHFGNNNGRSAGQGQGTAAYRRHKSNPHIDRHNVFPMSYESQML
ncbi:hypothetical protein EVAR_19119_1 [Eumeta japonica]|uniref:Uncharacterized protein n=1 Tax=Eumeta variegata TaxID=151549 RepID=A0A4C1SPT5_EUMVA|nr:hypothetical protein EVAR_19119_1 [Eumeta japonica]